MPNATADRSTRPAAPTFDKANKPSPPAHLVLPKPVKIPPPPPAQQNR